MAIDVPNNPSVGATLTVGNMTWTYDGTAWNLSAAGIQGLQGSAGYVGADGAQGVQGPQGLQGISGRDGNFGGATFDYTFSSSTAASDPTVGKLKFNNSNLTNATALYIDSSNDAATDLSTYLNTIDDSTSTIKGHFRVSKKFDASVFALYTITSLTDNTGWFTVNCSYVSGSTTSFTDADDIVITFARTGDKGDTGIQGTQGLQGSSGVFVQSDTAPSNPVNGQSWYDTTSGRTYTWYDSFWVETGGFAVGTQGVQGTSGTVGTGKMIAMALVFGG